MPSSLDDFLEDNKKNIQKKDGHNTKLKVTKEEEKKKEEKRRKSTKKKEETIIPLDQLIENKAITKTEKKQSNYPDKTEKAATIIQKKKKENLEQQNKSLQREKENELKNVEKHSIKEEKEKKIKEEIEGDKQQFNIVNLSLIKRSKKRVVLKPLNLINLVDTIRSIPGYKNRLNYTIKFVLNNNSKITPQELAVLLSISEGEAAVILRDAKLHNQAN